MGSNAFLYLVRTKSIQRPVLPYEVYSIETYAITSCVGPTRHGVQYGEDYVTFDTKEEADEFAKKLQDIESKWDQAVEEVKSNIMSDIFKRFEELVKTLSASTTLNDDDPVSKLAGSD